MAPTITVLNGPNLNLLGKRQPDLYGTATLADVEALCLDIAAAAGFDLDFRQSNHEGALVDAVHEVRESASAVVVNAGAYTHTSGALHDALVTVEAPVIEVHLTNVHAREGFRRHSFVSPVAVAVIAGCGPASYAYAIQHAIALHHQKQEN
jgi:3-dehydroquinate dehydratase II